jgi:hypothetical protein
MMLSNYVIPQEILSNPLWENELEQCCTKENAMSRMRYCRCVTNFILLACCLGSGAAYSETRGAVTALASGGSQASAFVGFSSGAVLYCTRLSGCTALEGTPGAAVTAIDTPRAGNDVRAWVGYDDGSIYFCTLTGGCILQKQEVQPDQMQKKLPGQ